MWHRLLLFLYLRNEFDWAPPCLGPEVKHPYYQHATLRCCEDCGGGKKHAIHQQPWDKRRTAEILQRFQALAEATEVQRPEPTEAEIQERAKLVAEFRRTHQFSKPPFIEREH